MTECKRRSCPMFGSGCEVNPEGDCLMEALYYFDKKD